MTSWVISEKAVEWTQKALQIKIAQKGPESKEVAYALNSLGIIYQGLNDVNKADSAYSEAYRILQLHPPASHPHLAVLAGNIASVKSAMGDVEAAKSLYNQALNSNLAGGRHIPLSADYFNLGTLYMHLDDPATATPYMEQAFKMTDSLFAAPHVRRSNVTDGLAALYYMQQEYAVADSLARTALQEKLALFGPDHPEVGRSYYSLGLYADGAKKWEAAKRYYGRSLTIRRNSLGEDHADFADVLKGLGFVNWQINQKKLGLDQLRQSLEIFERTVGTSNQSYLEGSYYLADYFGELDQQDSVRHYLRLSWGSVFGRTAAEIHFDQLSTYDIHFMDTYVLRLIEKHLHFLDASPNQASEEKFAEAREILAVTDELLSQLQPILNFDRNNNETLIRIRNVYNTGANLLHDLSRNSNDEELAKLILHCLRQSRAFTIRSAFRNRISMQFASVPDSIVQLDRQLREQLKYIQARPQDEGTEKAHLEILETWRNHQEYLETHHPKYFQLNYAKPEIALDEIKKELQRQEASLLAFFDLDSTLLAVTITEGQFKTRQLTLPAGWADSIYVYRELLELSAKSQHLASTGHWLYQQLWRPLAPGLQEKVIVIPDGPLHYLSFETLLTGPTDPKEKYSQWDWLLKSHTIHYRHTLPGQEKNGILRQQFDTGHCPRLLRRIKGDLPRGTTLPIRFGHHVHFLDPHPVVVAIR